MPGRKFTIKSQKSWESTASLLTAGTICQQTQKAISINIVAAFDVVLYGLFAARSDAGHPDVVLIPQEK